MRKVLMLGFAFLAFVFGGCKQNKPLANASGVTTNKVELVQQAEGFENASQNQKSSDSTVLLAAGQWLRYQIIIPQAGRYSVEVRGLGNGKSSIWLEDYSTNTDGRTYNITGDMPLSASNFTTVFKDGSPLNAGVHNIKIHAVGGEVNLDYIKFTLIKAHKKTPQTRTQNTVGSTWNLVWSDEFNGKGLPDTAKWSYNLGNWGWGNNEPQYYTENRTKNARQEKGALVIEAHKNDLGNPWTSARLTTAGKQSFLYGKIEFRAKVPVGDGTWAAGWLLGDDYVDELSWPYCGEIDVLECVGFEIDDKTGNGLNHASCHTRAYYFKQNNQITAITPVQNMQAEWHTYSIEWYPDVIYAFVDGVRYYTYDKTKSELEWPFDKPQNIILNLTVGGGWGGAKGIDENWESHQFLIDYVRVYELK